MDYKNYSLEKLEEWMHDALSCSEATPQEIYDVIKKVVQEQYDYHEKNLARSKKLFDLLNGYQDIQFHFNMQDHITFHDTYYHPSDNLESPVKEDKILSCDKDNPSPECQKSWNDFWEDVDEKHSSEYNLREAEYYNKRAELDAVKKWVLPVNVDGLTGDCVVNFPDDLLEAANLKEGDQVEWVDQGDGSYVLKKVENK